MAYDGRARAGLSRRHAIDDVGDASPPDRVTAQHARFDGRIQRAATQIGRIEMLAGLAYGFHFGVRKRDQQYCKLGTRHAFSKAIACAAT
jgi:hypothetical protein